MGQVEGRCVMVGDGQMSGDKGWGKWKECVYGKVWANEWG